jgi:hypothetical protein
MPANRFYCVGSLLSGSAWRGALPAPGEVSRAAALTRRTRSTPGRLRHCLTRSVVGRLQDPACVTNRGSGAV